MKRKKQSWEKKLPCAPNRGAVMRDLVLRHIGDISPKSVPEIHQSVVYDYGDVTQRAVYRHISNLTKEGLIKRVEFDEIFGYVRSAPPRWDVKEQVYV